MSPQCPECDGTDYVTIELGETDTLYECEDCQHQFYGDEL
jgi:transposase-like protein